MNREKTETFEISVSNPILKQLEDTVQMGDICAEYKNRQYTSYIIAPDNQLINLI